MEKEFKLDSFDIEGIKEVREFLTQWYSVEDLYFKAAEAGSVIVNLASNEHLKGEELEIINALLEQHIMMIHKLAKFQGGCNNE